MNLPGLCTYATLSAEEAIRPLVEAVSRDSVITFPLFGNLTLNPPAAFTVFGRTIYLYGVIIALAFLAGMMWSVHRAKYFGLGEEDLYDVFLWILPSAILGARLYYVLFRLDYYRENPGEIFAVWEGGLAVYGGILAGAAAVFLVCRRKKIPPLAMLDLLAPACMLGQAIGRWGNFFNREAFGRETDVFCRMGLSLPDGGIVTVHPTFLYESLWNFAGFLFLASIIRRGKRQYDGQCLWLYFLWYGIGRSWIEGLRTDSLMIGNTGIRVSQVLSLALALFAAGMLLFHSREQKKSQEKTQP